jgi:hypothetical protein
MALARMKSPSFHVFKLALKIRAVSFELLDHDVSE